VSYNADRFTYLPDFRRAARGSAKRRFRGRLLWCALTLAALLAVREVLL